MKPEHCLHQFGAVVGAMLIVLPRRKKQGHEHSQVRWFYVLYLFSMVYGCSSLARPSRGTGTAASVRKKQRTKQRNRKRNKLAGCRSIGVGVRRMGHSRRLAKSDVGH